MTANVNKWIGVILSAVVLGMAVVYLINTWMPECTKQWIVWVIVALIAVRSVMRIAQLAKQAGENEEK